MTITVYIPADSAAIAQGADRVAAALTAEAGRRGVAIRLIRNGSRGMFWLEPLVEVVTAAGRIGFGPVAAGDVPALFDADFLNGGGHRLNLGVVDDLPWLCRQDRLTFARVGITDPLSPDDYLAHGGLAGLRAALGADIVQTVIDSGLRGRGGAAFPTGIKWRTTRDAAAAQKYVVCNADEGDSGTFADRLLMEGDPFLLLEGMAIAGLAVGASEGFIYIRSEYPRAFEVMNQAVTIATGLGWLGDDVLGAGRAFRVRVRKGAGSYVCGEETALLESLEGNRPVVRAKPPLPAISGLFGQPTIVNNVVTLATVPVILARGAECYREFGTGRSRGTLALQLAGNVRHGGLMEKAFGLTLAELIDDFGGGTASGRPLRAVQVGGPLGAYLPPSLLDTPLDYEAFAARGATLGHGGVVVFDGGVDMARQARFAMEFCAIESCGKCTPCRIGSTRGVEIIDRIVADKDAGRIALLRELCEVMQGASLCAMGGMTPIPVLSALEHFAEDFQS